MGSKTLSLKVKLAPDRKTLNLSAEPAKAKPKIANDKAAREAIAKAKLANYGRIPQEHAFRNRSDFDLVRIARAYDWMIANDIFASGFDITNRPGRSAMLKVFGDAFKTARSRQKNFYWKHAIETYRHPEQAKAVADRYRLQS